MIKKILIGATAVGVVAAGVAALSAFEAHIINVTARIENALSVSPDPLEFGTVFPQEKLYEDLTIAMSGSFLTEDRVDDIEYVIKQKPKPRNPDDPVYNSEYCVKSWEDAWAAFEDCAGGNPGDFIVPGDFIEVWERCKYVLYENPPTGYDRDKCYPMLCPFLSKKPDYEPDNDGDEVGAPHWPIDGTTGGYLAKDNLDTVNVIETDWDTSDTWTIDLVVPCFQGMCAQDYKWWEFDPPLVEELEGKEFGCDLWIEVYNISENEECRDGIDNDGDTLIDLDDSECTSPTDNDESA